MASDICAHPPAHRAFPGEYFLSPPSRLCYLIVMGPDHSSGRNDRLRGILLLVAAVSLFGVVDGLSKMLVDTQSLGQIIFARYALALPVLLLVTKPAEWSGLYRTRNIGWQILRGLTPLIVGGVMVVAVEYLPLADATVILFAGPFMVVALSGYLLGERVKFSSWIAVGIGFLAVLIVARPGFTDLSRYAVFPLIGAVFYAVLQLLTRYLAEAGEQPQTTLAWTLTVGLVAATPLAIMNWSPLTPWAWLLSIALGVCFGMAQLMLVRAYLHTPANVLAPFSYAQIVAATIFGMIAFAAVPDGWTMLGIALIIGAGVYVVHNASAAEARIRRVEIKEP